MYKLTDIQKSVNDYIAAISLIISPNSAFAWFFLYLKNSFLFAAWQWFSLQSHFPDLLACRSMQFCLI